MKNKERYLEKYILDDLEKKMIFLGGARQVGKTTLLKKVIKNKKFKRSLYLNWDNVEHKADIAKGAFPKSPEIIFFDEIHKFSKWKNYLKGIFDVYFPKIKIIVSGSARLNAYKKRGDSLMGRYYYFRLHPFSLAEILGIIPKKRFLESLNVKSELEFQKKKDAEKIFKNLLTFGAFPEPFLSQDKRTLRRWRNNRLDKIVREDIRDLSNIKELSLMELLVQLVPEKAGSMLSINNIAGDLGVNYRTAQKWLDILENFYYLFRLYPYQSNLIKSLRKESKLFLYDYSPIENNGARFENLVASHLLKFSHFLYDIYGYKVELKYLKDRSGKEVDFLLVLDNKPWIAVEAKTSDTNPARSLKYFKEKLKIPFSYQVVQKNGVDFLKDNIRVISADKFLTALV